MPTEPKNGLDLLRWFIFEPILWERFEKRLSKTEQRRWLLQTYTWIIVFSCGLWLIGILMITIFDIPTHVPQVYQREFITQWQTGSEKLAHLWLIGLPTYIGLGFWLIGGLGIGLIGGLGIGLIGGLGIGVIGGLGGGFIGGLVGVLIGGIIDGRAIGFVGGLVIGLTYGLIFGFGFRISIGLIGGLVFGFIYGVDSVLPFIIGFYLSYFRVFLYPIYSLCSLLPATFERNVYRCDGVIRLPIWLTDRNLLRLATQQPEIALEFVNFLLEYRPLQEKLAMRLLHAATAGKWLQNAIDLNANVFSSPVIPEKQNDFRPTEIWNLQLDQLRNQFIASQKQSQLWLKNESFEKFLQLLQEFRNQTLRESRKWNHFYLEVIDQWLEITSEKSKISNLKPKHSS